MMPPLRFTPPVKLLALLMMSLPLPFLTMLVLPVMPLLPCRVYTAVEA